MVVNKLNDNLDVIQKIKDYIWEPGEVLNKAKLFDAGLSKNSITVVKVILVLVDFNQKMDDLLMDMQNLLMGWRDNSLCPWTRCPTFPSTRRNLQHYRVERQGT